MTPYGDIHSAYIGYGNGFLQDSTKSLPEPMLTSWLWDSVASTESNFPVSTESYKTTMILKAMPLEVLSHLLGANELMCPVPASVAWHGIVMRLGVSKGRLIASTYSDWFWMLSIFRLVSFCNSSGKKNIWKSPSYEKFQIQTKPWLIISAFPSCYLFEGPKKLK